MWEKIIPFINGVYIQKLIQKGIEANLIGLLCCLKGHKGSNQICSPSQQLLAQKIKRSVRTVQRWLKELSNKGIIKIVRRGLNHSDLNTDRQFLR